MRILNVVSDDRFPAILLLTYCAIMALLFSSSCSMEPSHVTAPGCAIEVDTIVIRITGIGFDTTRVRVCDGKTVPQ